MTDPVIDPDHPSDRRLQRAGFTVVCIILAIIACVFVGFNLWHGEQLKEDQATGENRATEHTGTKLD